MDNNIEKKKRFLGKRKRKLKWTKRRFEMRLEGQEKSVRKLCVDDAPLVGCREKAALEIQHDWLCYRFVRFLRAVRTSWRLDLASSPSPSHPFRHCHPIISRHIYKKTRDNHTCMHARTRDHRIGMADKTTTSTSYHKSLVSFSSLKCPHRCCSISHLSILCMHTHT